MPQLMQENAFHVGYFAGGAAKKVLVIDFYNRVKNGGKRTYLRSGRARCKM